MTQRRSQHPGAHQRKRTLEAQRHLLVSGYHAVVGILRHQPDRMVNLWIDGNHRFGAECQHVAELCSQANVPLTFLDPAGWRQLDVGSNAHGIAAEVLPFRYVDWADVLASSGADPIVVVLDGVTDPQNLGGILRSAAFFGPSLVVLPKDRSVHVTPTVERVAAGGASVVPVSIVTNLSRTLEELKEYGYWIFGTSLEGGTELQNADIVGKVAVVLGAEGQGMRRLTATKCDQLVTVSGVGIQSLNVATFAGILLYRVSERRRNFQ